MAVDTQFAARIEQTIDSEQLQHLFPTHRFPAFGQTFFWGVLQDCPAVNPTDPCVVSRTKTGSGNAVITFQVPYPWDANGWLG